MDFRNAVISMGSKRYTAAPASGSDPDHDPLTFTLVTPPAHGTLTGTAPMLLYTPAPGYTGQDAFPFTVSDGALTSAPATVTLTITPLAPDTTPPWAPTALQSVGVGATRVLLAWDAASDPVIAGARTSGVVSYRLVRAGAVIATVTTRSATDAGLTPQTSYTYQVEAVDGAGNVSQRSSPLPLTTAVLGDIDGDAQVTLADLRQLVQMLLGQLAPDLLHADLDEDGQLSLGDVRGVVGLLAEP
jgi:hypothetical protein